MRCLLLLFSEADCYFVSLAFESFVILGGGLVEGFVHALLRHLLWLEWLLLVVLRPF